MSLFSKAEYQTRLKRAQTAMAKAGIEALFLTQEVDFAYFAGFHTCFWQSPTRPWFLILPAEGAAIAVIPAIGEFLMQEAGVIEDIRVWAAPDLDDDGVSLLAEVVTEIGAKVIGIPSAMETYLRMPLADYQRIQQALPNVQFRDDANISRNLRLIKSEAEIAQIQKAGEIGALAFDRVPEIAKIDSSLSQIFRDFQRLCLEEGADFVPYLAGALDQNGYYDVISPATHKKAKTGDILMLDTGLKHNGYFCDFNRNFSFGAPEQDVETAHALLIEATDKAIEICREGIAINDIYSIMKKTLSQKGFQAGGGRLGHGLGLYLTEWPSIIPDETLSLEENMVMTIEPSVIMPNGRILVHEENIVIGKNNAHRLTPRYDEMVIL